MKLLIPYFVAFVKLPTSFTWVQIPTCLCMKGVSLFTNTATLFRYSVSY